MMATGTSTRQAVPGTSKQSIKQTNNVNVAKSSRATSRGAPLLETISALSSALIYSDQSSSSSSSSSEQASPTSSTSSITDSLSDCIANNNADSFKQNDHATGPPHHSPSPSWQPTNGSDHSELSFTSHIEPLQTPPQPSQQAPLPQTPPMPMHNKSSSASSLSSPAPASTLPQQQQPPPHTRSKVRFNADVQINESNSESEVPTGHHHHHQWIKNEESSSGTLWSLPASSSTTTITNGLNSTSTINQISSGSYLNKIYHQNNNSNNSSLTGNAVGSIVNPIINTNVPNTKSILKDPLCAKLRSALQMANCVDGEDDGDEHFNIDQHEHIINEHSNQQQQISSIISNKSSLMSIVNDNNNNNSHNASKNRIDPNQLESEIDQLLYGACVTLDMDFISFPDTDQALATGSNTITTTTATTTVFTNTPTVQAPLASGSTVTSSLASHNQSPCQTYIQMIEDKYRQQNNNTNNGLTGMNRTKPSWTSTNSKSGLKTSSNKNVKAAPSSSTLTMGNGQRKSGLAPFSITGTQIRNPNAPNTLNTFNAAFHLNHQTPGSNIQQLMNDLLQESCSSNHDTPDVLKTSSNNQNNNSNNKATSRQEQLYKMLSDPVKGPSINKLMSQLSGYWNNHSGQTSSSSLTNKQSSSNNQTGLNNHLLNGYDLDDTTTSSTTSSSNTRSSQLAENHIYEEILYECLQREQEQQQQQKQHMLQ